jgi:Zn-dependent M28 family amino/carboxypeptidase
MFAKQHRLVARDKDMHVVSDHVYNGANDNASGVAALIHLAQYYKALGSNNRSIIFIAFSGEEFGLMGSKVVTSILNTTIITQVINLEMLGRKISESKNRPYIVCANDCASQMKLMNKEVKKQFQNQNSDYFTKNHFSGESLELRSDHYTFEKLGIPAFSIMASSPQDPYYHTVEDEAETLDYVYFEDVLRKIAVACKVFIR